MNIENIKQKLKKYFQSGDVPTESQFGELIDEALNPDAARLTQGTLENARLPEQIDLTEVGENSSVKAGSFSGIGSTLTDINADHISQGTIDNDRFPKQINLTTQDPQADESKIQADYFIGHFKGDGSNITNIDPTALNKIIPQQKLPTATNENAGISRFASAEEAADSEITNMAVSPMQLNNVLSGYFSGENGISVDNKIISLTSVSAEKLPKQLDLTQDTESSRVTAHAFAGDGSELTNLQPESLSGILPTEKLPIADMNDIQQGNAAKIPNAKQSKWLNDKIENLACAQPTGMVQYAELNTNIGLGNPSEIDGHTLKIGDLVLLTAQENEAENRVWRLNNDGKLEVASEYNDTNLVHGTLIRINNGNDQKNKLFTLKSKYEDENGNTERLIWSPVYDRYFPGDGIIANQNRLDIDFATEDDLNSENENKVVNAALFASKINGVQGEIQSYRAGKGLLKQDSQFNIDFATTEDLTNKAENKAIDSALFASKISEINGGVQNYIAGDGINLSDNIISTNKESLAVKASKIEGKLANSKLPDAISGKIFSGDGANLTGLNAGNITSGTISPDRLPAISSINQAVPESAFDLRFDNTSQYQTQWVWFQSSGQTLHPSMVPQKVRDHNHANMLAIASLQFFANEFKFTENDTLFDQTHNTLLKTLAYSIANQDLRDFVTASSAVDMDNATNSTGFGSEYFHYIIGANSQNIYYFEINFLNNGGGYIQLNYRTSTGFVANGANQNSPPITLSTTSISTNSSTPLLLRIPLLVTVE